MKNNKRYFSDISGVFARSITEIIENMYEDKVSEISIYEAEKEPTTFYCIFYYEVGEKSDRMCGKSCKGYIPRNGIKGCCKHRGFCYSEGKAYVLTIDGKLTPKL